MNRYLPLDEIETYTFGGVKVAWVGEDGDALAFTGYLTGGEAAILAMARRDLGGLCRPSEPPQVVWMRFHIPEGGSSDEWSGERCAADDEGAIQVVWARELTSQREEMLAERTRLLREHPDITTAAALAPLMGELQGEYWRWIAERSAAESAAVSS